MILTETQVAIRDAVRAFAEERLAPGAAARDREHHFPGDELKELGALGFLGMLVPEEHGGSATDLVSYARAGRDRGGGRGLLHHRQRAFLGGLHAHREVRHGRAEAALPAEACQRRMDRRLRLDRAAGRVRRGGAAHTGAAGRRSLCARVPSSSSPRARTAMSSSSSPSPIPTPARRVSRPSSCPPTRPATRWCGWRRSSASIHPIPASSPSTICACPPT